MTASRVGSAFLLLEKEIVKTIVNKDVSISPMAAREITSLLHSIREQVATLMGWAEMGAVVKKDREV